MAVFPDSYDGRVINLQRDGYGRYTFSNKFFTYEGDWMNGKKHGHGKLTMNDGSYYEGDFVNDEIIGRGVSYDATTGSQYSGVFHMGEKCGTGLMRYEDESVYDGQWVDNKRQGYGKHEQPSGEVYSGFYHNHLKHGEGTQIFRDGSKYIGHWIIGLQHGHGLRTYADGSHYEGQWRHGVRQGIGVYYHISGCKYEGLWTNDKPNWQPIKLHLVLASENNSLNFNTEFSVIVECLDENKNVCDIDEGREIQILVGITKQDSHNAIEEAFGDGENNSCTSDSVKSENKETDKTKKLIHISTIKDNLSESQFFALVHLGIKMEEMHLLRGTINVELDDNVVREKNTESVGSFQSNDLTHDSETNSEDLEKVESKITSEDEEEEESDSAEKNDEKRKISKESGALSEICSTAKEKIPKKVFYTEFDGIAKISQGRVLLDQLMISRKKESTSQESSDKPFKLVVLVRDITCPPFMDVHLKPDYIIKEL